MADAISEEPLSTLSDSSFVVIGQGSLPPISNEECCCIESRMDYPRNSFESGDSSSCSKQKGMEISQGKFYNSIHSLEGDAEEKMNQLLKENYQLKETLNQNNLAIKSQLNTFFTWQQEVLKIHENHKKKFLETKELILNLQANNADLKKQLESRMEFSISNNNAECIGSTGNVSDDKEKSDLNEEMNKLDQMCKELTGKNESLVLENSKLKEKLKEAQNEVIILSKDLEYSKKEIEILKIKKNENECLKNSAESNRSYSLPNSEARAQISNLFKQLEEEKAKVTKLKEELNVAKSNNSIALECKLSTTEELTDVINELDDANISFNKQSDAGSVLDTWVSLEKESVSPSGEVECKKNVNAVSGMEQAHLCLENACKQKQEDLEALRSQFSKLSDDYKDLQQKLALLEANSSAVEKYKAEILMLSNTLSLKEQELAVKKEKLKMNEEDVAVLKVQVDLYKSDFNDERAAREKLVGEKEELAEQIRLLESKIKDLQSEKQNGEPKESSSSESETTGSPLEFPSPNGKKGRFVCPKCMFSFNDLKRCEEHVDECLDNYFYP